MKIGIISLGLIGGSILKALYNKGHELYAVTGNKKTIKTAKKYTKVISHDIYLLRECEVIFVCSPIENTGDVLDKLEVVVNEDCVVTDVASVKIGITEKKRKYRYIN